MRGCGYLNLSESSVGVGSGGIRGCDTSVRLEKVLGSFRACLIRPQLHHTAVHLAAVTGEPR